ncbi:uncharacterized protein LOC144771748 [Lissotriton helveticus]
MAGLVLTFGLLEMTTLFGACTTQHASTTLKNNPVVVASSGDSVNLTCSRGWHNLTRFRSEWEFHGKHKELFTPESTVDESRMSILKDENKGVSVLKITGVKPSDAGIYRCTIHVILPPPAYSIQGNWTTLVVFAPPRVWLSSKSAPGSPFVEQVTCAVSEFYPAPIHITMTSACGEPQELENSVTQRQNPDGTYSTTRRALLNTTICTDGTEVTCSAKHETGDWNRSLRISHVKNKGLAHRIPTEFLIRTVIFAAFLCIICVIFLTYNMCCEQPKKESPIA